MKKIIIFVLLFAALKVAGQTTGYLRFDTVRIMKQNGTCELYIINKTKDSLGLLTNIGGGLTTFKKPRVINDSAIVVGNDTLKIVGNGGKNLSNSSLSATGNYPHNWKGFQLNIDSIGTLLSIIVRKNQFGLNKRTIISADAGTFPLTLSHAQRNTANSADSVTQVIQYSPESILISSNDNNGPDASIDVHKGSSSSTSKIKLIADSVQAKLPSVASADSAVVIIGYNDDGTRTLGVAPVSGGSGTTITNASGAGDTLWNGSAIKRIDHDATILISTNSNKLLFGADTSNYITSIARLRDSVTALQVRIHDSMIVAVSNIVMTGRLDFIHSGTSSVTYQNDTLIGKQITFFTIESYPVGFIERSNSVWCEFDSVTGTITLTNGKFCDDDHVIILYRTTPIFLLDEDGNPVRDGDGNFIILN